VFQIFSGTRNIPDFRCGAQMKPGRILAMARIAIFMRVMMMAS